MNSNIFLSIKPVYARKILTGEKTIELRKFKPTIDQNGIVFLYATSPVQKVVGFFLADTVVTDSPARLWKKFGKVTGVLKSEYDQYFAGCTFANGILVKKPYVLEQAISLQQIREIEPAFRPPQGYLYLKPPRKLAMYLDVFVRISTGQTAENLPG